MRWESQGGKVGGGEADVPRFLPGSLREGASINRPLRSTTQNQQWLSEAEGSPKPCLHFPLVLLGLYI